MVLEEVKHDVLNRLKKLSVINQLVDTHYVTNKVGQIEVSKVVKEYDSVRNISEKINYKLKSHRVVHKKSKNGMDIIISDLTCDQTISPNENICSYISRNINQILMSEIKLFKNTQISTFKFFNKNWIDKLLNRNNETKLIDTIISTGKNSSWIMIPYHIFDIINGSEFFEKYKFKSESIIHKVGKLSHLDVFVNPNQEDSFVFYANYDSIMLLIDKNIHEKEIKSGRLNIESKSYIVNYLFIETGMTKILNIT